MRVPLADRIGQRFNRLVITKVSEQDRTKVVCQCDCGREHVTRVNPLVRGRTKSCGCLNKELTAERSRSHGYTSASQTPEITKVYRAWMHMKDRCLRPNTKKFKNHGGRGITIHGPWVVNFELFLKHVGVPEHTGLSLDRVDNELGYVPGNVRWATTQEQNNNKRTCRYVTYEGVTKNITQWAHEKGLNPRTLRARLFELGMPIDKAFTTRPNYSNRVAKDLK
jgi:hypothetical protein